VELDSVTSHLATQVGPWALGQLLLGFLALASGFIARSVVTSILDKRVRRWAGRTQTRADDMAVQAMIAPVGVLLLLGGAYLAFRILTTGFEQLQGTSGVVVKAAVTIIVAWMAFRLADAVAVGFQEMAARTDTKLDDQIVPLLRKAAKVFIGILAFVLVVQNLGYSVSGLLAGLGIGGLAFALAAKDTIANLFGSITILIDRPFRIGDWITLEGADGVIEEIGLRSTRIRTFAKTVVSIPNQGLANATVENHSLMPKRRVKMTVGVTYGTSAGQMRQALQRIEAHLKGHDGIDQEFILVKFTEFGDSSLNIFLYYFTVTTDWTAHLALRQEINLAVMDILGELGLEIAFPTRTVHLIEEAPRGSERSPQHSATS
jgi:MscS family membrane protein